MDADPDAMALVHTPTEEVPTPDNLPLQNALARVVPNMHAPGVGANLTMLRTNQYGVADTELARIQVLLQ